VGFAGQSLEIGTPSLIMIESIGLMLCAACAGISVSSPVAEVKRTVNESPYMMALATTLRREVIAYGPTMLFQAIVCLPVGVSTAMILI
jgi:hypothetical protein